MINPLLPPPVVPELLPVPGLPQAPRSIDGSRFVANLLPGQAPGPQFSPTSVVQGSLDQLLDSNNSYISNARRRGAEQAGSRGLLNSSIAAGASERSAIEAARPLLDQAMAVQRQREAQGFQGQESALDRIQGVNRELLGAEIGTNRDLLGADIATNRDLLGAQIGANRDELGARIAANRDTRLAGIARDSDLRGAQLTLDRDAFGARITSDRDVLGAQITANRDMLGAELADWTSSQQFTREFNGALSMLPIKTAADLTRALSLYAMENPETYTPAVVSGMSNFFSRNMVSILQTYFPNTASAGGTP